MEGTGFPVTLHERLNDEPIRTISSAGWESISGATEKTNISMTGIKTLV